MIPKIMTKHLQTIFFWGLSLNSLNDVCDMHFLLFLFYQLVYFLIKNANV